MRILVDGTTRVITQGMTGNTGSFHTQAALDTRALEAAEWNPGGVGNVLVRLYG